VHRNRSYPIRRTRKRNGSEIVALGSNLNTERGKRLLAEVLDESVFIDLATHFTPQQNLTFCGVASASTILNALGLPRPESGPHKPFVYFTQDNFFLPSRQDGPHEQVVRKEGMPLLKFARGLEGHGANVEMQYASEVSINRFRSDLARIDSAKRCMMAINYNRPHLGQEGGGHISPVAAFHKAEDLVLIADVAAYRYPFVWASTSLVYDAMAAKDASSGLSRGYCVVKAEAD